ncbi:MAG: hypothetical protein JNL88_08115 [Bacteroidia bacterium]|nr:hypothetical protein [Bacteroidia bacterium]
MKGVKLFVSWLPSSGMAVFPFLLFRKKDLPLHARLLNHERIHLRQQVELLVIPFYIWYLLEYLFYRLKGKNHYRAYRSIRFEREAYAHDADAEYLKKRKTWAFLSA